MKVEFDPLALLELNDAVDYYNYLRRGLGDRFKNEVRLAIIRIPGSMATTNFTD